MGMGSLRATPCSDLAQCLMFPDRVEGSRIVMTHGQQLLWEKQKQKRASLNVRSSLSNRLETLMCCPGCLQALMAVAPRDPDAHLRRDLTHLVTYTVDDASTTEVDDAISIEELPGGKGQKLWIHVADPTRWVTPGEAVGVSEWDQMEKACTQVVLVHRPYWPSNSLERVFDYASFCSYQHRCMRLLACYNR
jgi:hypothetical protein